MTELKQTQIDTNFFFFFLTIITGVMSFHYYTSPHKSVDIVKGVQVSREFNTLHFLLCVIFLLSHTLSFFCLLFSYV